MTSLAQAKNINSSGVYVVGHLDTKKGPSTRQGKRLSSKNVIRLTVTLKGENEEEQTKSYSINELKDLQSKLMLIAGKAEKGKEDVELFVRVSHTYMKSIYQIFLFNEESCWASITVEEQPGSPACQ